MVQRRWHGGGLRFRRMNPDEEDPAQDRLSALRQVGFVDALWPVPRWVNFPTSLAKQVPHERISDPSGDGCGKSCRFVPMPLQRIWWSRGLNMLETASSRSLRQLCRPNIPSPSLWYKVCVTTLSVRRGTAPGTHEMNASWSYSWNEEPGRDSASSAVEA